MRLLAAPIPGTVGAHPVALHPISSAPPFAEQVRPYAKILGAAKVRGGLLFTQDGGMRWV